MRSVPKELLRRRDLWTWSFYPVKILKQVQDEKRVSLFMLKKLVRSAFGFFAALLLKDSDWKIVISTEASRSGEIYLERFASESNGGSRLRYTRLETTAIQANFYAYLITSFILILLINCSLALSLVGFSVLSVHPWQKNNKKGLSETLRPVSRIAILKYMW